MTSTTLRTSTASVLGALAWLAGERASAADRHVVEVGPSVALVATRCACDGYALVRGDYGVGAFGSFRYALGRYVEIGPSLTVHFLPTDAPSSGLSSAWSTALVGAFRVRSDSPSLATLLEIGVGYHRMDGSIRGQHWAMNGGVVQVALGLLIGTGRPLSVLTQLVGSLTEGKNSISGSTARYPLGYLADKEALAAGLRLEVGFRFSP